MDKNILIINKTNYEIESDFLSQSNIHVRVLFFNKSCAPQRSSLESVQAMGILKLK